MSDHLARYFARLDAHLLLLADDAARRKFLRVERRRWIDRYLDFQARVDAGAAVDPGVHAADYIVTLAEIDARLAQLAEAEAEVVS